MTNTQRISDYYRLVDRSLSMNTRRGTLVTNPEALVQISGLFSPHAVYERQGCEPMRGEDTIHRFFSKERALCGTHVIGSIREVAGIAPQAQAGMARYFPAIAPERCHSVLVEGQFGGAQCFTTGGNRFVQGASGTQIPFHDVWVIAGDQVLYRASQLELAAGMNDDIQQQRRTAGMGR